MDLNVARSSLVASIEAGGPFWDVSITEGSQGCALEEPPLQCLVFSRSAWLRHDEWHGLHTDKQRGVQETNNGVATTHLHD
jgi:hypothetical protein